MKPRKRKISKEKSPSKPRMKVSKSSGKVTPSPEVLEFMRQRPPISEALIRQVVVEDLSLAEAGERYLARQMGPPKDLRRLILLPRRKLKSAVASVAS